MRFYSDPSRENDKYSLPDCEVFHLTANEAAQQDEDLVNDYLKRYPLATMNSSEWDKMLSAIVDENGITGGWFYWYCLPGCLPDSSAVGPFKNRTDAVMDAIENATE